MKNEKDQPGGEQMDIKTRNTQALLAMLAAGVLALAGCASADPAAEDAMEKDDKMEKTDEAMEEEAMEEVEGTLVNIIEKEFEITLSEDTFAPGVYTFAVENHGGTQHSLVIEGDGIDTASTKLLSAGDKEMLIVDLPAGTYELWCSVGSHRQSGMSVTITVA
jgi:uncharacterized cupredoxin-like copper-binding protein